MCGAIRLSRLDQITGCFGQDQHSRDEYKSPGELDGDRDAIGASVIPIMGRVVDDRCQEKTDGDGQLIGPYNHAADPFGSSFRLIKRNCGWC